MNEQYKNLITALGSAIILQVDGYMLHNWNVESEFEDDDDIVLEFSYTDSEGLTFEFQFSKKALEEAVVSGLMNNRVRAVDVTKAIVVFDLFDLTPHSVAKKSSTNC
jgi:hypothetical protein